MTSQFRLLSCVLLATVLAACATTYVDPSAADGPAATLEHQDALGGGVLIDQLDGRQLGIRPVRSFTLPPGEHSLRVRANVAFRRSAPVVRWFDAAPHGRYRIETEIDRGGDSWGFAVIDLRTGQRVDRAYSSR